MRCTCFASQPACQPAEPWHFALRRLWRVDSRCAGAGRFPDGIPRRAARPVCSRPYWVVSPDVSPYCFLLPVRPLSYSCWGRPRASGAATGWDDPADPAWTTNRPVRSAGRCRPPRPGWRTQSSEMSRRAVAACCRRAGGRAPARADSRCVAVLLTQAAVDQNPGRAVGFPARTTSASRPPGGSGRRTGRPVPMTTWGRSASGRCSPPGRKVSWPGSSRPVRRGQAPPWRQRGASGRPAHRS